MRKSYKRALLLGCFAYGCLSRRKRVSSSIPLPHSHSSRRHVEEQRRAPARFAEAASLVDIDWETDSFGIANILGFLSSLLLGTERDAAFNLGSGALAPRRNSSLGSSRSWVGREGIRPVAGSSRRPAMVMQTATKSKIDTTILQDEQKRQMMMEAMRGKSVNTDESAAQGVEMQVVEFERGTDELPLKYDPEALKAYFSKRPEAVAQRLFQIGKASSGYLTKVAIDGLLDRKDDSAIKKQRAGDLRDVLTSLGPLFIKLGQALSIRPDILPPDSMVELQQLCDKVPVFDSKLAMQTITNELGKPPQELFEDLSAEPLAAASLGQVYKGKLRATGDVVAVKVQRPFVLETVSLDLYLLREFGMMLRRVPGREGKTDLVGLVDEFAGRFYDELDYRVECENGIKIAQHMASLPNVVIPKCYPDYTSRRVHTAEWVDGEKLAVSKEDDVQDLVNLGVVAYLTQLLGEGFFHADPHPGNMIRTPDGRLCILDFGLMTELTEEQKVGMIEAIVHLIQRDYTDIGRDFQKLDFIPKGVNVEPIVPALSNVFDAALAGGGAKSINFNELSADLAQITFDFPFRIPPYFALVIRAIGVLEGIALVGNPDFAIIDEAFPYISQRLLTDKNPRLREALRYLVYGRDGVFDADRLIDLLIAFQTFEVTSAREDQDDKTSQALSFFFSDNGEFLRELLLEETVRSVDVLSRNALQRLRQDVPALRAITPAPLRAQLKVLTPKLTPDEEKSLRSVEALLEFFLSQSGDTPVDESGTRDTLQTIQRLNPVLQEYRGAMTDYGRQVVGRLVEVFAVRFMRSLIDNPPQSESR